MTAGRNGATAPGQPASRMASSASAPPQWRVPTRSLLVTVVVAVYGNADALSGLVLALGYQSLAPDLFELIVVDNHLEATVSESVFVNATFACQVVHEPRPGLSRARNAGIRRAGGTFVLITDPDTRPESTWAEAMVAALTGGNAFCAGGLTLPQLPEGLILPSAVLPWFVPPTWPRRTQELGPPYWLVGCNLAFRRTEPVPLFDLRLGVVGRRHTSCEDLEFVMRAQAEGKRVLVVPGAVVHRNITLEDLRLLALLRRAFWHGVSVARLVEIMPAAPILDSYRLRNALQGHHPLAWLTLLARIGGFRGQQIVAPRGRRQPAAHPEGRDVAGTDMWQEVDRSV